MGGYSRKILSAARWIDEGLSETDRRRIVRGTQYSFLIQGGSVALVFLSNLLLVRASDPDSYGLYVHVFNWVSILSVVVLGGRDDLVLAQLPRYSARQRNLVTGLIRAANRWVLGASVVAAVLFVLLLGWVHIKTLSDNRSLFRVGMIAVYLTAALALNQLVLQALNHVRLSQVVEKLAKPFLLIVGAGGLWLIGVPLNARVLILLACAVLGICFGLVLGLVVRSVRRYTGHDGVPMADAGSGRVKIAYFFAISLLTLSSTKVTMLILPGFLPVAKDIGIFNIAYRFADLLIFPFFLMHTVLPQLFARHAVTGRAYTQSLFSESNKLMVLLSVPLLLVNFAAGPMLLRLFGPQFSAGYRAMIYISLAQFLFSLFGPANTILMMQDNEKYSAGCLLVYVCMLVATSWWLIPSGGISGGALAILVSSAVYNVLLAGVVWRVCRVRSPFLAWLLRVKPAG
ncbi:MAG TPA: polysaccharide biosynthesis C-terminal domain-containing protein [Puia sp.]|nr:polysaccharide biosynthesis C-terminal domain-containing protein [Puia sp.]